LSQNELLVLLAVAHVGNGAYGVSIAQAIEDASGQQMALASVYGAVQRLEAKGLVRTRLGEPTAERGGRAKRIVEITKAGRQQAVQTQRTLRRLGFAYQT
jgi:DNA-binding PadR family transcriptional regulator